MGGLIALTVIPLTFGASYCVGPSGTGTYKDGRDWNNLLAWSANPYRGDVWYLVDGANYSGKTFNRATAGSTLITIKKATVADHGGINAGWLDTMGDGQAVFGGIQFNTGYWTFDGVTGGGPGSWNTGFGFKIQNYGNSAVSSDGNWSLSIPNVTIRHVEFIGDGSDDGSYAQVVCHDMKDSWTISHCFFNDHHQNLLYMGGNNCTVQYCYFGKYQNSGNHGESIAAVKNPAGSETSDGNMVNNLTVRYCVFTATRYAGNIVMRGIGLQCYGNIFAHLPVNSTGWYVSDGMVTSEGTRAEQFKIYNNTFIDTADANTSAAIGNIGSAAGNVGNDARNNLFYNIRPGMSVNTHTYNHYVSIVGSLPTETERSTGTGDPFVEWTTSDGWGLITNTPPGTNLGAPYNVDMYGNTRTTWTRGALEYVSGEVNTNPPAIQTQPVGLTNSTEGTLGLSVTIAATTSTSNLVYRWRLDETEVGGSAGTNSTYTVPSFTTNSGGYDVVITNYYGGITSTVAQVLITNPVPRLWVEPNSRDYGAVHVGVTSNRTFTVKNIGIGTLSGTSHVAAPFSIYGSSTYSLGSNELQMVTVSYTPTGDTTNEETVTFTGGDEINGWAETNATVTGSGFYVPVMRTYPNSRDYGTVAVGGQGWHRFYVVNTGDGVLQGEATVAEPFTVVYGSPYTVSNQTAVVSISYTPMAGVTNEETVTFTGGAGTNVTVTGIGAAEPPPPPVLRIVVDPTSVDFGSLVIGGTTNVSVVLSNAGTALVEGTAAVEAPFSIVSGSPYSIETNATAEVVIQFEPASAGVADDVVVFTGGDGAECDVTGMGTNPPAPVSGGPGLLAWPGGRFFR